jgi:hypothetical protein
MIGDDGWRESRIEEFTTATRDRYGITAHRHPRRHLTVVISSSDWFSLREAVMLDPQLSAVGRGYYLFLGGELDYVIAPDWACDPLTVAALRIRVVIIDRPFKPIVRKLADMLGG